MSAAALLALLEAIPGLVTLGQDGVGLINELITFIKTQSSSNPQGWVVEVGQVFGQLNAAKSKEDYANAAKGIADLWAHAPRAPSA